ncbi:MAG: alpha/beta hydrolase [Myxococcales bacterium]|nr:alpha/beta hydrolase [Myxococcales bacterium]
MEKKGAKGMGWQAWVAWILLLPLALMSLLSIFRAPTNILWLLSVGVIEWGHWLVLVVGVGCFLARGATFSHGLWGIGIVTGLLLLSPWMRASVLGRELPKAFEKVWGKQPPLHVQGAFGQERPLMLGRLWGVGSPKVRVRREEVTVGDGQKLPLEIYRRVDVTGVQPLVVVIHGGAWKRGDIHQLPAVNHYLAARGFTVASITYRLAPKYQFPAQRDDVEHTIRWLQSKAKEFQFDPQKLVLLGRSAGAHLALLVGYRGAIKGVRGVVDLYGPTDMNWSWGHPSNPWVISTPGTLGDFLGGTPKEKKAAYDAASPLYLVQKNVPPTLIIHGFRDELVSYKQSRRLAKKLQEHGVKHFLLEIPWASHGCEANLFGPSGQMYLYALERFLRVVALEKEQKKK